MSKEKSGTLASREWRKRNPARRKELRTEYKENHPDKYIATKMVWQATQKGILPKVKTLQCANPLCGNQAAQYHHCSYEPEHFIDVIPLCVSCHTQVHHQGLSIESLKSYKVELSPVRRRGPRTKSKSKLEHLMSAESEGLTRENLDRLIALAVRWGICVRTNGATVVVFLLPQE